MRELSSVYLSSVLNFATQPGYLVEVVFPDQTLRLSSRETVTCMGQTWITERLAISGLSQNMSANSSGYISFGINPDYPDTFTALALNQDYGFTDRVIKVWLFDFGTVTVDIDYNYIVEDEDVVLIFDGVGDSVSIDATEVKVTLATSATNTLYAPRVYVTKDAGFNFIQPKGTRIPWGSEIFVLE